MMPIPFGGSHEEYIQQIEEQDAGWIRLGEAISSFLIHAFPNIGRGVCGEVGDALSSLMTTSSSHQISRLKSLQQTISPYGKNAVQAMARMVEDRDRIVAQIELAERGIQSMREHDKLDAMADIMEASSVGPLRGMLAQIEDQISTIQKSMEETAE